MSFALADYLHDTAPPAPGPEPGGPRFVGECSATQPDLLRHVFGLAERLRHERTANTTRVLVACRSRVAFAEALLGAWQAGLAAELPPDGEASTMARLGADPDVLTILHDTEGEPGWHVPTLVHDAPSTALRTIDDDEPLVVLHTSGSTAAPRRFAKTARALLGEVEALYRTFGAGPATFLATVPAQHLYGLLFGLLLPLRRSAKIAAEPTLFPGDVVHALAAHAVTHLVSTPTHLRALTSVPRPWPRDLTVLTSGAPMPADLHERLTRDLGWTVHDVLGSTETGGIATRHTPGAPWHPLDGVTVRAGAPDGHLQIESAWSSVTRADDVVRVHEDGTFDHLGRLGHVVKVAGKRVDTSVVEAALRRIDGVTDAAVLAEADPLRGSRLLAFVTGATTAAHVRDALALEFDATLLPKRIVLGPLPREANGKLRRERLLELAGRLDEARTSFVLQPESTYFEGHFLGEALYPGAASVADVVASARRVWPDLGRLVRVQRIRFQIPLTPMADLQIVFRRSDAAHVTLQFEVILEGKAAVTGRLEFARSTP